MRDATRPGQADLGSDLRESDEQGGQGPIVAFAGRGNAAGSVTAVSVLLNSEAAVAEEAFFRRFAYGWLERIGTLVAWGGSALAFALMHVPFYGTGSFWVNLGAGFMLSWQRWASGGWAAPAATHVVANQLAVIGSPVG
jgi:hypothetical protein